MSGPKFTTGPWHVEIVRYECYVCNEVGLHVLTFDGSHFDTDSDIANAHLIAAAPEMYEALEEILSDLDTFPQVAPGVDHPEVFDLKQKIRKLLRKARGESDVKND